MDMNLYPENSKVNNTEKITINTNVVDLGQIDLLVEQGFYSNRTDFIKTAIRSQLSNHTVEIRETSKKWNFSFGIASFTKKELTELLNKNAKIDMNVVGMLILSNDIPVDLALKTINSIKVRGSLKVSNELREALKDRIK